MLLFVVPVLLAVSAGADTAQPPYICASRPDIVGACFDVRGRLSFWNGTPSARLWPVGTKRLLGVHADLLPPALQAVHESFETELWADFTVCPFTKALIGHMQFVCIESWRNLITKSRVR